MKQINEYTTDELSAKIKAIKAERERTANALKKYEEELERREQEVPLGVPLGEGRIFGNIQDSFKKIYATITLEEVFESIKSYDLFFDRLKNWRQEYTANSKGEPIGIQVLLPLLPKGWVAMDTLGLWRWYQEKPEKDRGEWKNNSIIPSERLSTFNLKRAKNWETSLRECGL